MAKTNATKNLKFGDEVMFREGQRGKAARGVVLSKSNRQVTIYQPLYGKIRKISPETIVAMANTENK